MSEFKKEIRDGLSEVRDQAERINAMALDAVGEGKIPAEAAWLGILKSVGSIVQDFKDRVPPERMGELAQQVVQLEFTLSSMELQAMLLQLWERAEKDNMTFGQYLYKLEQEGSSPFGS